MGTTPSVQMEMDADSLANPGSKVVLSEDLSSVADYDTLVEATLEQMKNPLPAVFEPAIKSRELTEHSGPDDFTIKIMLDIKKLEAWGQGKGRTEDPVAVWNRITLDRAAGTFRVRVFHVDGKADAESEDKPLRTYVTTVLKDPLRLEGYMEEVDGDGNAVRSSAELCRAGLLYTCDPVVRDLKELKVKVKPEAPSRVDPSKMSAMSEPLDSHTSMSYIVDKFWECSCETRGDGAEVLSQTETEMKLTQRDVTMTLTYDQEGKRIDMAAATGGKQIFKSCYVFHADPLQLEAWSEDPESGTRSCGVAFAKTTALTLNKAVTKAQSWFG